MSVYVDDMRAERIIRGMRMVFCHMVADTSEELHAMAATIGVREKWLQDGGTYREHFDICLTKRALAVDAGALEVAQRDVGLLLKRKREAIAGATDSE